MRRRYIKVFCDWCEQQIYYPAVSVEDFQERTWDLCDNCVRNGVTLEVKHIDRVDGDIVRVKRPVEVED